MQYIAVFFILGAVLVGMHKVLRTISAKKELIEE